MFSLVIPSYNERDNIGELVRLIYQTLTPGSFEVIVVDDDSPDGTGAAVQDLQKQYSFLRLIRRTNEKGLSLAVLRGFEEATGEILGVMDADLSHDEKILPLLIDKVRSGTPMAIGSRRIPGGGWDDWPWYRYVMSYVAATLTKVVLGVKLSDPMSGYFVIQRSLYDGCKEKLLPRGYKIMLEIYCRAHPPQISEIPFIFKNRKRNVSKLSPGVIFQFLRMIWSLRFQSSR